MTGTIKVTELNNNGIYVSNLDHDKAFADEDNPSGAFKMVIEPLDSFEGPMIEYKPLKDGYLVHGEGYIISGTKKEIEDGVKEHRKQIFNNVVTVENNSL